jgi:hypothetical protein
MTKYYFIIVALDHVLHQQILQGAYPGKPANVGKHIVRLIRKEALRCQVPQQELALSISQRARNRQMADAM